MVNPNKAYKDMYQLSLTPGDLLVLRTSTPLTAKHVEAMVHEIKEANPDWNGLFFVMSPDESFEKMSESTARRLHQELHKRYGVGNA